MKIAIKYPKIKGPSYHGQAKDGTPILVTLKHAMRFDSENDAHRQASHDLAQYNFNHGSFHLYAV